MKRPKIEEYRTMKRLKEEAYPGRLDYETYSQAQDKYIDYLEKKLGIWFKAYTLTPRSLNP